MLKLSHRNMVPKPLFTQEMKDKRLAFWYCKVQLSGIIDTAEYISVALLTPWRLAVWHY
jgi:hypothetical protein